MANTRSSRTRTWRQARQVVRLTRKGHADRWYRTARAYLNRNDPTNTDGRLYWNPAKMHST
jgi:hypothetical protein